MTNYRLFLEIAKRLRQPHLGYYLPGIWEAQLPEGLTWVCRSDEEHTTRSRDYLSTSNRRSRRDPARTDLEYRGPRGHGHLLIYPSWKLAARLGRENTKSKPKC
jgi:hypothetical protein